MVSWAALRSNTWSKYSVKASVGVFVSRKRMSQVGESYQTVPGLRVSHAIKRATGQIVNSMCLATDDPVPRSEVNCLGKEGLRRMEAF